MCPCFGVPRLSTDKNLAGTPTPYYILMINPVLKLLLSDYSFAFCPGRPSSWSWWTMQKSQSSRWDHCSFPPPPNLLSRFEHQAKQNNKPTNKRSRPPLLFSLFAGCCGNKMSTFGLQAEKFDLISLVPNIHLIMKTNIQVTADTIYTSKQFQRIKDNFDVSINYDNSYFNITVGHLMASCRILYREPWKACVSKML